MGFLAVNFRYKNENGWSKVKRIDFYTRESVYTLPVWDEYVGAITIELEIASKHEVEVSVATGNSSRAVSAKSGKYKISIRKGNNKGKVGLQRLPIAIRTNEDTTYTLNVDLPLDAAHLTKKQFQEMLDDISHWVFFELAAPVKLGIDYSNKFSKTLRSQQAILSLIKERMDDIKLVLQQISHFPKQKFTKQYYRVAIPSQKQDFSILRLENRFGNTGLSFTYRHNTSYDVYENRFLLFFLYQLKQWLEFLEEVTKKTTQDIENDIFVEKGYTTRGGKETSFLHLSGLKQQRRKSKELIVDCQKLAEDVGEMQKTTFLNKVSFNPEVFSLGYSLSLTQDFNYGRIFSFYQELVSQEDVKRLDIVKNFKEGLFSLGVKHTSKIYEYWTFFAVYKTLIELHFYPENERGLLNLIRTDTLVPNLEAGRYIHFLDKKNIYDGMHIYLYYDKSHLRKNSSSSSDSDPRPDITMEVKIGGRKKKIFLFDAKYKSWDNEKSKKNNRESFWTDYKNQLVNKYSPQKGIISDSCGAFLFHTNTPDTWFENYGAFVQDKENGEWRANKHDYGFIPVVPGETGHLKTLLAMIFLVKLKKKPKICWICGSTNIEYRGTRVICNDCQYEWQVSYCGLCRYEPLYRSRKFNFQPYCKNCGMSVCPSCGKCFGCRVDVNKIKERGDFVMY